MKQVPSMTYQLTLIDRVNGYTTDYCASEYANRLAATKLTIDGATKSLIRERDWVAGAVGGK
jgi:hypothetical protein